jgi:hypothetical protein
MNKLSKLKETKYWKAHRDKAEDPLKVYEDNEYKFTVYTRYTIKEKKDDINHHWVWLNRKPERVPVDYTPSHGVTLDQIIKQGHKVRVSHLRYANYARTKPEFDGGRKKRQEEKRFLVVPASFRHSGDFSLSPFGGYTHVHIKTKGGKHICVSSECSIEDNFCYRCGVKEALERLNAKELAQLLN